MTMQRNDRDWSLLKNEYNICRKKLESKKEGIKILMKDLENCQIERDIYKNKVCQLQQELDELKELVGDHWRGSLKNGSLFSYEENADKKIKTLTQLIQHIRKENQALRNDLSSVKQLYAEAQQDNQLLKETLHQHESRKKESTSEMNGKIRLVEQLEETQNKIEELKNDIENLKEEKNEIEQERDHFKEKTLRLNTQLNYALHNDDRRIVDIDALVLENKYLKEVSKQYKAEKAMMVASVTRYKEAIDRRFNKASRLMAYLDVPLSFRERAFGSHGSPAKESRQETVNELQRLTTSLTESLADKDTALKIQKKTNRVLGMRVKELEKKLRTLEISGLWSFQDSAQKDKLSSESSPLSTGAEKAIDEKESVHRNAEDEVEASNDLEDTCWDPYCEQLHEFQDKDHRCSETLIDLGGCHSNDNNGYNKMKDLFFNSSTILMIQ
ncbi:coiled-coil domain-containing protein 149-like isoform X2 [Rhopilema esculentum]|uniref:coiled-coil domain-containing protein 149-like isoform X2 n=1 Tax=Rhopilema esculentum TaxID=499914 RepID=UPI0031CE1EE7